MLHVALRADVEATGQAPVGGDENEQDVLLGTVLGQQGLGGVEARAGHVGQHTGDGVLACSAFSRARRILAVEIISIVRVICMVLLMELMRLCISRRFAMSCYSWPFSASD